MNKLKGKITKIEKDKSLAMVTIEVGGLAWKSIIIDSPDTKYYLETGSGIEVVFKETEVVVGKKENHAISIQNRISGEITQIQQAKLVTKISIETKVGAIHAIVTTKVVKQLELEKGMEVLAMVKTNELMLQK